MYTNELVTVFRKRLSDLCEESPMNDTEIAKGLKVSKQTVSAWKSGERSPKQPTIETIARFFDVNIDWLLGFDVPKRDKDCENKKLTPEDELDGELSAMLAQLSAAERLRVRDFAEGLLASHEE